MVRVFALLMASCQRGMEAFVAQKDRKEKDLKEDGGHGGFHAETRTKRDNAPIIIFVLAVVAALSVLAGYLFKPNQSGAVTSTHPTTQSPVAEPTPKKKKWAE